MAIWIVEYAMERLHKRGGQQMQNKLRASKRAATWAVLLLFLVGCVFAYALHIDRAIADEPPERPATPVRPNVPPRATPQSTGSVPMTSLSAIHDKDPGGYIELRLEDLSRSYSTLVEWMDPDGIGHAVDGWRGNTTNGSIKWFVGERDFGKGPFRWQIYEIDTGVSVAETYPFYLPRSSEDKTIVLLQLNVSACEQTSHPTVTMKLAGTRTRVSFQSTPTPQRQRVIFNGLRYCLGSRPVNQ